MKKSAQENQPGRKLSRRNFLKLAGAATAVAVLPDCAATMAGEPEKGASKMPILAKAGGSGDVYVPKLLQALPGLQRRHGARERRHRLQRGHLG